MIVTRNSILVVLPGVLAVAASIGCRKSTADEETGQIGAAVGEVLSSLDESTQGGVATAMRQDDPTERTQPSVPSDQGVPIFRTPDELRGPAWRRVLDALYPSAFAGTCGATTFSACDAGVRSRTFSKCEIGLAILDGTVTLTFNEKPLCAVLAAGDAVTRTADFTLTGLYGGTLTVSSPGGGQTLTKTATGFEYTVAGMERILKGPAGRTLFDVSTRTTAPIEITGSSRADRVIVSGALEVTHHLAGYKVTLMPSNLTWTANCNCAVSGSLSGTVSGGKHDGKSAAVTLTACGEADVTIDGQTDSITLDRCMAL